MSWIRNIGLFLGCALALVVACGQPESPDRHLLDGPADELSAEQERLRRLQAILILTTDSGLDPDGDGSAEISDDQLFADIAAHCASVTTCIETSDDGCGSCEILNSICVAGVYMQLSNIQSEPLTLKRQNATQPTYTVPAQSEAATDLLTKGARHFAAQATFLSLVRYRQAVGLTTGTCTINVLKTVASGTKVGDRIAASLVESIGLFKAATARGVEATLAVADAQRSWTESEEQAAAWAVSGLGLSRSAAAHDLIGGDYGLNGSFLRGFCSAPTLSPEARRAMALIRQAAPFPGVLTNASISITTLLNDAASAIPTGSLRQRLGVEAPELLNTTLVPDIAAYFRLEHAAFTEARDYLAEEIAAFSRSQGAILNPLNDVPCTTNAQCVSGQCATTLGRCLTPVFERKHGATASKPWPISEAYWGALANNTTTGTFVLPNIDSTNRKQVPKYIVDGIPGLIPWSHRPLSDYIDGSLTDAQEVYQAINTLLQSGSPHPDRAELQRMFNPVSLAITDGVVERPARVVYCTNQPTVGNTTHHIWVPGYKAGQGLRIVKGEDGLRCATQGTVEGQTCSQQSLDLFTASTPATDWTQDLGGFQFGVYSGSIPHSAIVAPRWYLVAPKPGQNLASLGPGSYRALAGYSVRVSTGTSYTCNIIPIVPAAQRRAADVLAPSRDWCTKQVESCAGVEFDARMPLESELTSDADDIESSWRRYLTLARQAADESDALGQDYILSAIEADRRAEEVSIREEDQRLRAEAELEILQGICGSTIEPRRLLELLSAPGTPTNNDDGRDLSEMRHATATCSATTSCPSGYHCTLGTCVRILSQLVASQPQDPELTRLRECVEPPTSLEFVTPGTIPLCLFVANSNLNRVCEGATGPCPILPANADAMRDIPLTREARVAALLQADCSNLAIPSGGLHKRAMPLGYFDSLAAPLPPSADRVVCDDIRRLRYGIDNPLPQSERLNAVNRIMGSNLFNTESRKRIADNLGFSAEYGTHGSVIWEGRVKFTTGNITQATLPTTWPCAAMVNTNCSGRIGMMCNTQIQCSSTLLRYDMIQRWARAVAAAKMMVFEGERRHVDILSGMFVPVYFAEGFFLGDGARVVEDRVIGAAPYANDEIRVKTWRNFDSLYLGDGYLPERAAIVWTFDWMGSNAAADNAWGPLGELKSQKTANGLTYTFGIGDVASLSGTFDQMDPHQAEGWGDLVAPAGEWWAGLRAQPARNDGWFRLVFDQGQPIVPPGNLNVFDNTNGVGPHSWVAGDRFLSASPMQSLLTAAPFTDEVLLDALELMCEASAGADAECNLSQPPTITSVKDLNRARDFLICAANNLESTAALSVFANMPDRAITNLRAAGGTGSYPAVGGDIGAATSRLRGALNHINNIMPAVAHEIRQMGHDIDAVGVFVEQQEIQEDIIDLNHLSTTLQRSAECAIALSPTLNGNLSLAGGVGASFNPGAAAATCANSFAQIRISKDISRLQQDSLDLAQQEELINFQRSFETRGEALRGYAEDLQTSYEEIDAKLAEIEDLRDTATRALTQAIFMSSFQAEKQEEVSTAMQARRDTAKARYAEAFKNAKLMAFLAKRAIEQRLGMSLEDMREDLPLVEAPTKWSEEVCNTSGVDYATISTPTGGGDEEVGIPNFADAFIGDYVTKLENLVESYVLVNNFHEGSDTAVISIRDDVLNVRAPCETDVNNLLYHSSDLRRIVADSSQEPGWELRGCLTSGGALLPDCISPITTDVAGGAAPLAPFPSEQSHMGENQGFLVKFGRTGATCNVATPVCGFDTSTGAGDPESVLLQKVVVEPGIYRISWYGDSYPTTSTPLTTIGSASDPGSRAVAVELENGTKVTFPTLIPFTPADPAVMPRTMGVWARYFVEFEITSRQTIAVLIRQPAAGTASVRLGAFMLENISDDPASIEPGAFASTGASLTRTLPVCEDTDGERFRDTGWDYRCISLCSDGFTTECAESEARTYCFYETEFNINQSAIEAGEQLVASGFARGNFNYRIDSIGVNFVGSGTRNCEDSSLPATCYNAGFIPYSLRHQGPYIVRNHLGQDYEAKLFTGNIEHARGLATERYLSNPVSDSDRSLIEPYVRRELEGRPLDGNFILRVWQDDGVNFEGINDVQIVVNYRYWTRFD